MSEDILELVQAHTRYDVKCECGEYLLKRANGFMSSRDQWELHFSEVLNEYAYCLVPLNQAPEIGTERRGY